MLPDQETFLMTSPGGTGLHGVHWPVPSPRALVLIVHGLGEHIGRYRHLADRYRGAGMAVAGFDHPGHGLSDGKRGHAVGMSALLENVSRALDALKKAHPDSPVFLHGQSMGGNIALHYGLRFPGRVRGIIASSPWIQLAFPDPAFKVALGRLMSRLWPSITLPSGLDPRKISRADAVVKAYVADELVHDRISAGLGMAMLNAARELHALTAPYPVPLLLLHGDADGLTSHAATKAFSERVEGNTSFLSWPGAYHELHNEPEQLDVFQAGLTWMEQYLQRDRQERPGA